MKKIIFIVLILAITASPVSAGVDKLTYPKWATKTCIETIYKIVQHESGNMKDDEVFSFLTEQIIKDITSRNFKCEELINWRWRIGRYSLSKVSIKVKTAVLKTLNRYPKFKYPTCKFVGTKSDIPTWEYYGYNTTIGFEKTVRNLTIVGVDCG